MSDTAMGPDTSAAATLDWGAPTPRWFRTVFSVLQRVELGALEFELRDGRVFRAEGTEPGPEGRAIVHDDRLFTRMVKEGSSMGFAEAYLDGWWSTPDLQAVLDGAILNNERVARGFPGARAMRLVDRARHWMRRNTERQARKNIEAHYDLGNSFYRLWLDPSMTYSSALFEHEDQSLEDAQRAKYRSICDRMQLKPGDHVLEIGCGWGGFAEYAAAERGARVTGLTLSPAQLDYARTRMQRAGLSERVDLQLRDYRHETGRYDGVASIEMFEAVGEKYWPVYFESVRDRLRPGGLASIQVITVADALFERYRRGVDFVQKHVFPGGMLPSPTALRREAEGAGLHWEGALTFGESYSKTLRLWRRRFNETWGDIQRLNTAKPFDTRFHRLWNFYLASCAACFRAQTTDVAQVALRRI